MRADVLDSMLHADLFKDVEAGAVRMLLESNKISDRRYPQDKLIMLRGEAVDSLIMLLDGSLQAQIQGEGGRTLRIEVLKAPAAVAAGVLFSDDNRLPVSLLSLTDVRIIRFPKRDVIRLCSASDKFMRNYFSDMGNKISVLAGKIRMYQFSTIRQKIAGYILDLSGEMKLRSVKLVYSKEVIAEIMGVTRPSLSRELSNMSAEGIIEVRGKTVEIVDRSRLASLLSGES